MTEAGDGGIILEMDFRTDHRQTDRAAAAVAAAVAELRQDCPTSRRIDLMRRKRAERFFGAFPELSLIELAVNEYLGREAQAREALDLPALQAEAAALARGLSDLMARLGKARQAMHWAEAKQAGAEVADQVEMAHGSAIDAWQAMNLVTEGLETAARQLPVPNEKLGRAGALGRLTVSADVALYEKLSHMFQASGLSIGGGDSGHGMDVFLFHAIKAADPEKVAGGRWLEKLREKANRQLSTEIAPPEIAGKIAQLWGAAFCSSRWGSRYNGSTD